MEDGRAAAASSEEMEVDLVESELCAFLKPTTAAHKQRQHAAHQAACKPAAAHTTPRESSTSSMPRRRAPAIDPDETNLCRNLRVRRAAQLIDDVGFALSAAQRAQGAGASVDAVALLEALTSAASGTAYRVRLIRAVGGGEGSSCLHNLRHTFLVATPPGGPRRGTGQAGGRKGGCSVSLVPV
eukprot:351083-Chlamydomonas_euryale.AAC.6